MNNSTHNNDISSIKVLNIPSADEFITAVSQVMKGGTIPSDGIYFRMTLTTNDPVIMIARPDLGTMLYTPDDLVKLRQRFKLLTHHIELMETEGFVITRIEMAYRNGLSGSRIVFMNPKNQKYTNEYFRAGHTADLLIPDDFLQDTKMFPSRLG